MRRSSTRRTWVLLHPATGVAGAATVNKATAKEQEKIDGFFNQYADKAEDHCIGPEGIEALCEDLGVPPTDVRILLLAWKLQAARQGYFSLEEWRKGLKSMRVDSLDKLRKALPSLQQEMEQSEYKAMNLDQWSAFLRFCDEIKPDLRNYDESQAWPLLLDNYVEWAKKGMVTKS